MGYFVFGMFIGGAVGVFAMALCTAARTGDDDEY